MQLQLNPGWVEIVRNGKVAMLDPEEFAMLPFAKGNENREWWDVCREYVGRIFEIPKEAVSISEIMEIDSAIQPLLAERQEDRKKKYGQTVSLPGSIQASQGTTSPGAT